MDQPSSETPLIDEQAWQRLWASLSADGRHHPDQPPPPILREVADRYAPVAAQRLQQLRALLEAGHLSEAARLAHAVKGNGAMLGATRVVSLAAQLEQRLPRLPVVTAEVLAEVSQLERACTQTGAELAARTA